MFDTPVYQVKIWGAEMKDSMGIGEKITTVLVLSSTVERFSQIDPVRHETPNQLILQGITDAALSERVSVPVQFVDSHRAANLADPDKMPPALKRGEVSGVIICSSFATQIISAIGSSVPCVAIPQSEEVLEIDSAGPEHIHAMASVVKYLYQLGHRRIGFIGMKERAPWMHGRFAGYLYGMNSHDLEYDPSLVINMYGDRLDDKKTMQIVVAAVRKKKVTAWVCVSDGMAGMVIDELKDAGINVPQDVSVTGFDGLSLNLGLTLTTIRVPWEDIGEGALHAMLERIRKPHSAPSNREYIGEFVAGESSSAPPDLRVNDALSRV